MATKVTTPATYTAWFYQCSHCATWGWALTISDAGPYVRCNGCGGSKKFMYRENDRTDPDVYEFAKQAGVAHLPIPKPGPRVCVRCGETKPIAEVRVDGLVCRDCYQAEEHPEPLTPERMAENVRAFDDKRKRDKDREQALYDRQQAGTTGE